MKIYFSLNEIRAPFYRPAVTVGNFDGMHIGHQALFKRVVQLADGREGEKVAVTFNPHPLQVLMPDNPPRLISPLEQKIELIRAAGVDNLVCIPFTREFASISADGFVEDILCRIIGVEDLVVGYDYACGRGRQGDIPFLKKKGDELGFNLHVIPPVVIDGIVVSSSKIRELIIKGEMELVARMLGRYYQIRGTVRQGRKRGGTVLGFPTANIAINREDLSPKRGVYVVQVLYGRRIYGGVMNIGYNPTFGDSGFGAEVHIFDFEMDIYGQEIRVNLIKMLREEITFSGPEELAAQISRDVADAKRILQELDKENCLK